MQSVELTNMVSGSSKWVFQLCYGRFEP